MSYFRQFSSGSSDFLVPNLDLRWDSRTLSFFEVFWIREHKTKLNLCCSKEISEVNCL